MQIEYLLWVILAIILIVVELLAIRSVLNSERSSGTRGMWVVIIVYAPLLGLLAWWLFGPKAADKPATS